MQTSHYDICIVGGGMVGAALALGLAKQKYKVAVLESREPKPYSPDQDPDIRLSAFNMHSVKLLSQLGAWQHIEAMRFRPYDTLSVWEEENAITQFTAKEVKQPLLGYFVENRLVQLALYQEIQANYANNVTLIFDPAIGKVDVKQGIVELSTGQLIQSELVIGADGANSQVRQACKIACSGWQYGQQANGILIKTKQPINDETWQAFHTNGPRALLPMHDQFASLVWYDTQAQSAWIKQASHVALKSAIIEAFPERLGDFDIINVASFGLARMHAKQYGRHKAIILGDAAHTINPLAGQGVNLGFKDVKALLELIAENGISDIILLTKAFEKKRMPSNLLMMAAMDALYFTFSNPLYPIKALRGLGLKVANNAGSVKQLALKYAMGLS
jgi:2-octaprenyl-3-methyl-6-methoxy-1,4-benzoquinol hydroxylase